MSSGRSHFVKARKARNKRLADACAANAVHTVRGQPPGQSARKMRHAMKRAGHDIGRDRVARLMSITATAGAVRSRRRAITSAKIGRHGTEDLIERNWHAPQRPDK